MNNGLYLMEVTSPKGSFKAIVEIKNDHYKDIRVWNQTGFYRTCTRVTSSIGASLSLAKELWDNEGLKFTKLEALGEILYE